MLVKDLIDLIEKVNAIKDIVLVNGDAWVMLPSEAVEVLYMDYGNIDIKSFEYRFNRLVINI
jgi:hypothetical protein